MGRPSKLTPTQWEEIGRRLVSGETAAALGREFGVSQTVISQRFSKFPKSEVTRLGNELALLPPQAQMAAVSLADELRTISTHMAGAARYGASTAHRLAGIANGKAIEIDDGAPVTDESLNTMKGILALSRTANEAAHIGLNLLNANKESGKPVNAPLPLALNGSDIDG